ncbi:hypothetical protein JCM19037_2262 [Geomicrobium sp. JCM 19037]|uniref:nucleoside triphosphate pyrophosphohydrolase n=1 Tax=Geomicrobium sp. JCM 19037 TaxID=1460634 RepID=UPI00045F1FC8|nr:nucleoside triphosphate pyrophosphohydrolase [Geomicrobium sp. JCM 19037]GAK03903.1 hypothetical protein JCM19037_2262 [Geomicrobium sp. JCM 19037]
MPAYNKLVRDRILAIIKQQGKHPTTIVLADKEYEHELRNKLKEEVEEYLTASTTEEALEELADMVEVVHALASAHGSSAEQVEQIRANKLAERGGFHDRVFLERVDDDNND